MFGDLTNRLESVFKKLRGQGKLSEKNIKDALREVRRALLEADVNFKIAKQFIVQVQERAVGQEVMKSVTPGQQVVKIVHDELVGLMGESAIDLKMPDNRLNKIMMVGLQGSGKTTTCAKLAAYFRKKGFKPVLVACDVHRPAAVHQLQVLGKQLDIPVISAETKNVVKIAKQALTYAEQHLTSMLIFDTAGRLHIDAEMMKEVTELKKLVQPHHIFFVADATSGQDAVNVAREFNNQLSFTGTILTKMDGDARGGAALSINAETGKPVAFVGTGEKTSDLELFHPDRMANRILGMGDVVSLVEKAEATMDEQKAAVLAERLQKNLFTFTDFLDQLQQLRQMGPLDQLMQMVPGMNKAAMKGLKVDEDEVEKIEAIIYSMTKKEREHPEIIGGSRRSRIARGSGTTVQQINRLLKQFQQMKKMIKTFNNPKVRKRGAFPF